MGEATTMTGGRRGARWTARALVAVAASLVPCVAPALRGGSAAPRDATTRDATTRDATTRDATTRDATTRDATTRDATTRDATTRDASTRELRIDGTARRYRLHVPPDAPAGALPLVVAFHGAGASPAQQERASGLSALADRAGFVVAYPEGRRRRWSADARDEAFVRAVVADVAQRVRVDPRRTYATGISNGATMAARAACAMGDLFAAVATVAGVYRAAAPCRPARPLPVLAIHGLRDRRAPYDPAAAWASGWAERNACGAPAVAAGADATTRAWTGCADGADVVLQTLPALGHAWPNDPTDPDESATPVDATAEIWSFFAAHPMTDAVRVAGEPSRGHAMAE